MVAGALALGTRGVSAQTVAAPARSLRVNQQNVRFKNYLHDLAGPGAVVSVLGGGVADHFMHKGGNPDLAEDLARRVGERASQAALEVSVRHGLAAVMHRSTEYQPCECHGFGAKVEHALLETFTDHRADGSRALSIPRLASAYAGGFSRMAWEPDKRPGDIARSTTISLGVNALFNVARELTGIGH